MSGSKTNSQKRLFRRYLAGNNSINFVDLFGLRVLMEIYPDYIKIGGSVSWRNNNPGNIVYGDWATNHGAIGKGSINPFAKFPDVDTGQNALENLLSGTYGDYTIGNFTKEYAPEKDGNNPKKYADFLEKQGADPDKTIGEQLDDISNGIKKYEGWKEGVTVDRCSGIGI